MFGAFAVGGLIASLLAAPLADSLSDEPTVPTERIAVTLVTVNGSGCGEPAALTTSVADDNSAFTVTFNPEYRATVGVGALPTDFRKNCQLNVFLDVPTGFTFAFSASHQRGHSTVLAGATATVRWNMYFAGMSTTAYQSRQFAGPVDAPWAVSDVPAPETLIWHPCGEQRNYNFNTEIRVSAGTSDPATTTSFVSLESSTSDLIWRRCPAA